MLPKMLSSRHPRVDGAASASLLHSPPADRLRDTTLHTSSNALDAILSCPEETTFEFAQNFINMTVEQRALLVIGSDPTSKAVDPKLKTAYDTAIRELEQLSCEHSTECEPATKAVDTLADMDDVELVELSHCDEVRTGTMVGFWTNHWMAPVSTTFDNFIEDGAPGGSGASEKGVGSMTGVEEPCANRPPPSLDDFLGLDSEKEDYTHNIDDTGTVAPAQLVAECPRDPDPRIDAESIASSMSSEVALPGLEDLPCEEVSTKKEGEVELIMLSRYADPVSRAVLDGVREETDDCVHSFALDPTFDYDADLLGPALRLQKAWRR